MVSSCVKTNTPYLTGFSSCLFGSAKRDKQALLQDKVKQIGSTTKSGLSMLFESVLPGHYLSKISTDKRKRVYDEATTFWAWLSQILQANASCHAAVSNVQAWREQLNLPVPSSQTKAYCTARKRLSFDFINKADDYVLMGLEHNKLSQDLWCGFTLKAIDGSSIRLMDTPENQSKYPQPKTQKIGCGFPVMGVMGVVNLSHGGWETLTPIKHTRHDHSSIHDVLSHFGENDLCLADRAFNSYEFMAHLAQRGCESLMRLHQARKKALDWSSGTRLGKNDRIYTWKKRSTKHEVSQLSKEQWDDLPDEMKVRIVRYKYRTRDGQTTWMYVATSLLDATKYPYQEVCDLYHIRWHIEVKFRDIKTMLKMEFIRAKSPSLAEKTLLLVKLCYNMLYSLIQEACNEHHVDKSLISFMHTVDQVVSHSTCYKGHHKHPWKQAELHSKLLEKIANELLVIRPDRHEPRARKLRPKNYQLLTKPRHIFREEPHRGITRKYA